MRDMKYFILIIILFLVSERASAEKNWQIIGKMPHAVYGAEAVVLDSVIYILGGYSDSLARSINLIQTYDPRTNTWRIASEMVESRYSFVAAALQDSLIISCGGVSTNSPNIFSVELWNNKSYAVDNARIISYNSNFNRIYFTGHIYERRLEGVDSCLLGYDPSPLFKDIIQLYCKHLGLKKPLRLPLGLCYAAGFILELLYTLFGIRRAPFLTRGRVLTFYDNIEYSTEKLKQELGFELLYSLDDAIARCAEWYKEKELI